MAVNRFPISVDKRARPSSRFSLLRLYAKQTLVGGVLVDKRIGAAYERDMGAGWGDFSLAGNGLCNAVGHPEDHTPPRAVSPGRRASKRRVLPADLTNPELSFLG